MRGIDVDHVTLLRWVQRFTPELMDSARSSRHAVGDRWFVDDTYVKVNGLVGTCTGRWTSTAWSSTSSSRAAGKGQIEDPTAAVTRIEDRRTASVVIPGHAFIQNLRRGHYERGVQVAPVFRLATTFDELQLAI